MTSELVFRRSFFEQLAMAARDSVEAEAPDIFKEFYDLENKDPATLSKNFASSIVALEKEFRKSLDGKLSKEQQDILIEGTFYFMAKHIGVKRSHPGVSRLFACHNLVYTCGER